MSEALSSLLFTIRQHAGYQELIKELAPREPMPRFKKGDTLEGFGARTVYASGQHDHYENVVKAVLMGRASQETDS